MKIQEINRVNADSSTLTVIDTKHKFHPGDRVLHYMLGKCTIISTLTYPRYKVEIDTTQHSVAVRAMLTITGGIDVFPESELQLDPEFTTTN